ncbi:MAG TPA: hypothetical protein VF338_12790, partial [Leptolinea sp.]
RRLGVQVDENLPETVVLQAGMGLGILSVVFLITGSSLGINWITMGVLPLVVLIVLHKYLAAWLRAFIVSISEIWQQTGRFEKWIAVFTGLILTATLIMALAPPIKYDALMYHLVMPQTYVQQGMITHIPWLVMSGMPQATEMLYTMALWWGGLPAAALTGWMVGVLAIMGIIGFFQNGFDKGSQIGWVAAASLLAGETFASSLSWAYVDWTGLLFGVCCLISLFTWFNSDQVKFAGLAGLFAGLAFTTKYTGGILILCSLTAVLVHIFNRNRAGIHHKGKPFLLFCTGVCIFPLVWLIRNLILTGNPLYPFFLPAAEMDAVRLNVYQGAASFGEWWEGFLLPIRATLWGKEASEGYSVSIGPLLLLLGLGNLLRNRPLKTSEKNALQLGLSFFLSVWLFWAIGNRLSGYLIQTRMYYSIFPAAAVLAGLGLAAVEDFRWQNVRFSRIFGTVILLALGLSVINTLLQTIKQDAIRVDTGMISQADYQDTNLGWYAPAVRAIQSLPSGSRVLFLYEPRGLACVPICDPDEILDQWKISRKGNADNASVIDQWKQKGYNYLFVNQSGIQFLADGSDPHHPAEEVQALQDLLKQVPLIQSYGESYQLYKIP